MNEFIYPEIKPGLYIVSLPVGCLSDISFRALHMLNNSDYVAGEDTRNVKSLFKLLKISILIIYNKKNLLLFFIVLTQPFKCTFDFFKLVYVRCITQWNIQPIRFDSYPFFMRK